MLADMKTACAYYRTSSQTNVGADKDSLPRQQIAVRGFAERAGIQIVKEYYDAAVSGADPVDSREGFSDMLSYMLGNGARTVLVETANRFARDLMVQETGHKMLKAQGIELIAVDSPDSFVADTPTADLIRQMLGAVAQFEKAMLVAKLKGGRDRKRRKAKRTDGEHRCEGRKDWKPLPVAHVEAARQAKEKGLSLRAIASELQAQGFLNHSGKMYGAESVARMLAA